MNIFDALTMIGGLSLFLFGMSIMGTALERRAGNSLKNTLEKLTKNPFMGLLTGLLVTAIIQSSSATTVMAVGFVNSGLLTLRQSISVIMGANIGTTVTSWILSLAGIEGSNVFIKLLKPSSFTPILALIGIIFYLFGKSTKKKDTATILLGFATLMFGMETMSGAVQGLKEVPAFTNLFVLFENPFLGVLVGAVLTAVIQSSSASVGILQALASTGQISYASAIPIIMGQNIGTCVTALLSGIGANKNARRTALVHLCFNAIGTAVLLIAYLIIKAALAPVFLHEGATLAGIAICHSVFNVLCTLILAPCAGLLEKLVVFLIPDRDENEQTVFIDERLLKTPAVALQQCRKKLFSMATSSGTGLFLSLDALDGIAGEKGEEIRQKEEETDHYEDILGTYLIKLGNHPLTEKERSSVTKLLKMIGDFERIADHSVNILESAEEIAEKKIVFGEDGQKELDTIKEATREIMTLTLAAFTETSLEKANAVEALEQVIDEMKEDLRTRHILRLSRGESTVEAGFVWSDLLTNFERISDHCANVAACLLEGESQEMKLHSSLRSFRKDSTAYRASLHFYRSKYAIN